MNVESPVHRIALSPTSGRLLDDSERPYFVWWADITTGEFRRRLTDPDLDRRAYWRARYSEKRIREMCGCSLDPLPCENSGHGSVVI